MFVECWAIIILLLLMCYMIFRTGRHGQAVAIVPLVLVPLAHLVGSPLSRMLDSMFSSLSGQLFWVSFDVLGLVVTCVLCGMLAGNMGSRAGRRIYMIFCGGFSAVLTVVLVNAILPL